MAIPAPRNNLHKMEENKRTEAIRKKDSLGKGKIKISIKGKEKDNSRHQSNKLSLDIHQRSNQ